MKLNKLALIVAIAAVACGAMAQGGAAGGGQGRRGGQRGGGNPYAPATLAMNPDVQKEINVTDDQKTKLTDFQTSMRAKRQEAMQSAGTDATARQEAMAKLGAETTKSLGEILTPDQMKRLRELEIQWSGPALVMRDKELQTTLGITDDQKAKFSDLQKREQAANAEIRTKQQSQELDATQAREMRAKNQTVMNDEINKVLTDSQKTKLSELGGKPMTKPAPPQRGGGGL